MATLRWDRVDWDEFVTGLTAYRDEFSKRSEEDFAYLRCLNQLAGRTMAERSTRAVHIVTFLNAWKCRLKPLESRTVLRDWIRERDGQLETLSTAAVLDEELPDFVGDVDALYKDLMSVGRTAVANWSDAATSKALHQLVPGLFVMWDVNIKRFADDYRDFTLEMHRLGGRLIKEIGMGPTDAEAHLQVLLGYRVRKTMAKYLDEYNWYVMVGADRARR